MHNTPVRADVGLTDEVELGCPLAKNWSPVCVVRSDDNDDDEDGRGTHSHAVAPRPASVCCFRALSLAHGRGSGGERSLLL